MENQTEYQRLCDDSGVCHCDWRLTLSDCPEEKPLRIMYTVEAIASVIFALLSNKTQKYIKQLVKKKGNVRKSLTYKLIIIIFHYSQSYPRSIPTCILS